MTNAGSVMPPIQMAGTPIARPTTQDTVQTAISKVVRLPRLLMRSEYERPPISAHNACGPSCAGPHSRTSNGDARALSEPYRDGVSDDDAARSLEGRLRAALPAAMKAHDRTTVAGIRSALSAIANAEAIDVSHAPEPQHGPIAQAVHGLRSGEVTRRQLSETDIIEIVRAEVVARMAAADEYDGIGHTDEAARLRSEAASLETFLEFD
jgi:uncharacterized protein